MNKCGVLFSYVLFYYKSSSSVYTKWHFLMWGHVTLAYELAFGVTIFLQCNT